jgi:hypothetical protein
VRLGSHADRALGGKRGPVKLRGNPRLAATVVANTLTVATHAFFMDHDDLEKSWAIFMNPLFMSFMLFMVDSCSVANFPPRVAQSIWVPLYRRALGHVSFRSYCCSRYSVIQILLVSSPIGKTI